MVKNVPCEVTVTLTFNLWTPKSNWCILESLSGICARLEQIPFRRFWDVTFTGMGRTDGQPENKLASGRVCRGYMKISFIKIKLTASASLLCVYVCVYVCVCGCYFLSYTFCNLICRLIRSVGCTAKSRQSKKREHCTGMLMTTCLRMWEK